MKYLPHIIVIAVAFALGWLISPGDKVDKDAFEKERAGYERRISDLNRQIAAQDSISGAIRERMTQDSIQYAEALKRKDLRISSLNRKISEINLSYSDASDLDSIRAYILRAR